MRIFLTTICAIIFSVSAVFAQSNQKTVGASGLDVPRFVSLRSNRVNARSGPGNRYPIEWVYMQKNAPVEIIAEFEFWRKVKDWEGSESWVHKSMLTGKRYAKITNLGKNNLYAKADMKSEVIAKVEDEVVGEIVECQSGKNFCLLDFGNINGWILKNYLFGVYPKEIIE